jgi:hypothetical protein
MAKSEDFPEIGGVSQSGQLLDGSSSEYNIFDDIPHLTGDQREEDGDDGPLGYSANLTQKEALDKLKDTRFIQDIYDYYYEKEGQTFSGPEEAIEEFFSDRAWSNLNTMYVLGEAHESFTNNDIQNSRLARLQNVYEQMPNFYEEGGRGWEGFKQNAAATLLDPVNLLGFGFGGMGAKAAAKGAVALGKPAFRAGLLGGIRRGAASEFVVGGLVEGVHSGATQARDMQLGLQDEFSTMNLAMSAGLGAGAGLVLGGAFGALGAVVPFKPKMSALKQGKLKFHDSAWRQGQAEGKADLERSKLALSERMSGENTPNNKNPDNEDITQAEIDEVFSLEGVRLQENFDNILDEIDLPADELDKALAGGSYLDAKGKVVKEPNLKEYLDTAVAEGRIGKAQADELLTELEAIPHHERMANALETIRHYKARADALEIKYSETPKDPTNPAAGTHEVTSLRQEATSLQATYNRYLSALRNQDTPAMIRAAEKFTRDSAASRANVDEAGDIVEYGEVRAKPTEPEPEIVEGEVEILDDVDKDIADFEAGDPDVDPDVIIDAEPEPSPSETLRAESAEIQASLDSEEKIMRGLRKRINSKTATPEALEEAQLALNEHTSDAGKAARKEKIKKRNELTKAAEEAEAEFLSKVEEAEALNINEQADEIIETQTQEMMDDIMNQLRPGGERTLTVPEGIIDAASSEAKTIAFIKAMDPEVDETALRKELRILVKFDGGTPDGKRLKLLPRVKAERRVEWMKRKVEEIEARETVYELFHTITKPGETTQTMPYGPRVFNSDLVEPLLELKINKDNPDTIPTNEFDTKLELAKLEYDKYLELNSINLFAELAEGMGEKFSIDDLMAEVLMRYGKKTHGILHRQMTPPDIDSPTFKKPLNVEAMWNSSEFQKQIPRHWNKKQREVLKSGMLQVAEKFKNFDPDLLKRYLEVSMPRIEELYQGGHNVTNDPGWHEGKNKAYRVITVNGKEVTVERTGKIQQMLQKSGPYGYIGELVEGVRKNGEVFTGELGGFTALQQNVLDRSSSQRLVNNPRLYKETKVKNTETGETVTQYSGENVEVVLELREVSKALRKLKTEDAEFAADVTKEIRDALVTRRILPGFRTEEGVVRGHEYQLTSPEDIIHRFPLQISNRRTVKGKGKDVGNRQFFAYKIARTEAGAMLQRTPVDTMEFGIAVKGYDLNDPSTYAGRIKKYEKIGGVIYEKQLVYSGHEVQAGRGEFKSFRGGDQVFVAYDPDTGAARMFTHRTEAPSGTGGVDTPQSVIDDISLAIKFLTKTSEKEAVGYRISERNNSPELKAARLTQKIQNLQAETNLLPHTAKGLSIRESNERLIKQMKADLKEIDPEALSRSKWKKRGEAILRQAEAAGTVPDIKQARKDMVDNTVGGERLTEEDILVGDAVADRSAETAAMAKLKTDLDNDAMDRFLEHQDRDRLKGDLADIEKRFQNMPKAAPDVKPVNRAKPTLFHHNGVEVDLANHFEIKGKRKVRKIRFLGNVIGSVKRIDGAKGEPPEWEIRSPNSDTISVVEHESMIQRELLRVFEPEIKQAVESGQLKPSTLGAEGQSFPSDFRNSNTYADADVEPDTGPIDRPAADAADASAAESNPIIRTPMNSFGGQIPEGRSFSVRILSGKLAAEKPVHRHASQKQLLAGDPISKILGKQTKEVFVLGHHNPSLRTRKQKDDSFVEFGQEHIPPEKPQDRVNVAPDRETPSGDTPEDGPIVKFKDDPDVVDPATRPISIEQARNIKIEDEIWSAAEEHGLPKLKIVGEAVDLLRDLERANWTHPSFNDKEAYGKFMAQMEFLNDVISYYAPHGIRWNNASRNRSMQQLGMLMDDRPVGEINAVMSVLRNLVDSDSALPRFQPRPEGFRYRSSHDGTQAIDPTSPAGDGRGNYISFPPNNNYGTPDFDAHLPVPDFPGIIHEIGHWSWSNLLTPKEKSMFWEAMGKYVKPEGGVDIAGLKARLPGNASNELQNAQEFFAQQFAQYALSHGKAGQPRELLSLWKRIVKKIHYSMERFLLGDKDNLDLIDPEMIPIFERILPDKDWDVNKYKPALDYLTPFGKRPKFLADKLVNWQEIKGNIERAIDSGDPDQMRDALGGRKWLNPGETNSFVQEAIAYKGKSDDEYYYNNRGQRRLRVRLLDEGPLKEINSKGQTVYQFMNSFFIRNKMLRTMRDIQAFQVLEKDESRVMGTLDNERLNELDADVDGEWTSLDDLDLAERNAEIADIQARQSADDEPDLMGFGDELGDYAEGFQILDPADLKGENVLNDPLLGLAMRHASDEARDQVEALIALSNATLNVIHEIQVEMGKQVGRNVKKVAGEGITINNKGEVEATYSGRLTEYWRNQTKKEKEQAAKLEDKEYKEILNKSKGVWKGVKTKGEKLGDAAGGEGPSYPSGSAAEIMAMIRDTAAAAPPRKRYIRTIKMDEGGTYKGETKSRTTGSVKRFIPHGHGTLATPDGYGYTGEWKGGVESGQGTRTFVGGDKVIGQFKNGHAWGEGVEIRGNGDRYEGSFVEGTWQGEGVLTHANRDKYVGRFFEGLPHGQGTQTIFGGAEYIGKFKMGVREGKGTMTFPSGNRVTGKWKDGSIVKGSSKTTKAASENQGETSWAEVLRRQNLENQNTGKPDVETMDKEVRQLLDLYRNFDPSTGGRPPKSLSDPDAITETLKFVAEKNGLKIGSRTTPYMLAKLLDEKMNVGRHKKADELLGDDFDDIDVNDAADELLGLDPDEFNKLLPEDMTIIQISKEMLEARGPRGTLEKFADDPTPEDPTARQRDLYIALERKILATADLTREGKPVNYEEYFESGWLHKPEAEVDWSLPIAADKPRIPTDNMVVGENGSVLNLSRRASSEEDFQELLVKAFEEGRDEDMLIAAAGLKHLYKTRPRIGVKSALVNRALNTENIQSRGVGEENGIPNRATAEVKEVLRKITHRDKQTEATARTLTYRMMNLMGKTQQNAISEANIMSLGDVQRLFGIQSSEGVSGFFRHAQDGPEFNQLRKTMRKLGASLKKTNGGANFIGLRPNVDSPTRATQPYTAVHEMGHLLVRGTFDTENRRIINSMYKDAVLANDARAIEISNHYTTYDKNLPSEAVQEHLAEEWFVDGFANYLQNRVVRTDIFGNVKLKGRLATMVDSLIEHVAYMVNGLLGNKTLRQQYRYLTFSGDMLANKSAQNSPVRNAVRSTGMFSMDSEVAPKYARETIDNFTPEQEVHAREFAGIKETEDIMDYVYYHGTPNGGQFNRATNPDVILEPSGPGALFGEGIYVSKANSLAVDYSEAGHYSALKQIVDGADIPERSKGVALKHAEAIAAKRVQISEQLQLLNSVQYRAATIKRATDIREGTVTGALVDDPAYQLLKNQERLASLYQEEKALWKLFSRRTGVERQPKVLPLLIKAEDTFHFDANTYYSVGTPPQTGVQDIAWLIYEMADKRMFTQRVGKSLIENLRSRQGESALAGDDLYEILIETIQRSGSTPEESKSVFTAFMRDQGYDSFKGTDQDPLNGNAIEVTIILDPSHAKHIDADTYDSDLPHMFADKISNMGDSSLSGRVISDQIELGRSIDHNDTAGVTAETNRLGMPNALQGLIRRTLRKEPPTMDDFDAVQRHSGAGKGGNWIRENSTHLRRIGAHWFGNIVKPEGGAGLFQKHGADLAGKVAPLIQALRELPDAGNAGTRWLKKNRGLAYPIHKGLGTSEPPASHQRIINALRAQDITTLNPRERVLAMDIAAGFKSELTHMRELGLPIGDVASKMNSKYYVPQVWDIGLIQASPAKFNKLLVSHFMREARKSGLSMDIREASDISTKIINRMIDTDGRIDVDDVLHRRMSGSSNPFMQRFLHLGPEDIPEMGEYMVRDLEGIVSRYYDKTTRVINMAKEFGINNHAAYAYIHVAQNGLEGASDLLRTGKTSTNDTMEMGVTAKFQDEVIPPLKLAESEIDDLMNRVAQVLGSTKASKTNNKQEAINLILSAGDINSLNKGQYIQFKHRAKAIVNALSDFESPANDATVSWMTRYMDVLNRKPLGSERAYSTSRKIRTFNSVTLLSWTTLTSMPDVVLPLVRTGSPGAWVKGWGQRWMGDPSYKQAARDIGVGIENLIHDNMTHMAGDGSQRFTHAFFNATLLTPWTNMQREVSALVGFNALKSEADAARRAISNGKAGGHRHKKALRFLERYGLEEYGEAGGPRLDDIRTHTGDDKVRYAIMRFVNETIFTPDPNDVPMWAQTPWGSLIFQLKSFPVMMGRMSMDVLKEAKHGNIAPLAMLLTAGSAFGMGANAAKDLIRGRGGEQGGEHKLRERRLHKTFVNNLSEAFGGDIENSEWWNTENMATLGFTPNAFFGWWVEGLMAMGGLGLIAEMAFNAADQADNGAYGRERMMNMALGPTARLPGKGAKLLDLAMNPEDNTKQRIVARETLEMVPILGGLHSAKNKFVDDWAGEAETRGSSGNKGGWIAAAIEKGMPRGNVKKRS